MGIEVPPHIKNATPESVGAQPPDYEAMLARLVARGIKPETAANVLGKIKAAEAKQRGTPPSNPQPTPPAPEDLPTTAAPPARAKRMRMPVPAAWSRRGAFDVRNAQLNGHDRDED